MDTAEVFELDSNSNDLFVQVIEAEDDVGANVVLSTASPPPPPSPPRTRPMKLVRLISSRVQYLNTIKASQNNVAAGPSAPSKPVIVQNVIEDYVIQMVKDEITPEEDLVKQEYEYGVTDSAQEGESETQELTSELAVEEYELLYPGGPVDQLKLEPAEEHDYVPVPEPIREFYCGVCGKCYSSEKSVRQHMTLTHRTPAEKQKREQSAKKVICELCRRTYASAAALRYHQRVHTGERPFQCPQCEKSFTMPLFLQIHIRTHTGERPYLCASCPKAFSNHAALLRHNRVHTGVKPYTCEQCGKSFTQSNSRKLHIRTVHLKLPAPYISKERRLKQLRRNALPQRNTKRVSKSQPGCQQRADTASQTERARTQAAYVVENGLDGAYDPKYEGSDDD